MLRSPLITLAAVGAGLGGLLLVNATQAADNTATEVPATSTPAPGSTTDPIADPSADPTGAPSADPTADPTDVPSAQPTGEPTASEPTTVPTQTVPTQAVPTQTVPTQTVPTQTVPTQTVPVRPTAKPPSFPARIVYAGRTSDRRSSVAIAVLNGRAAAYFCDGRSVESWFTGTATNGLLVLRSKRNDTVRARLAGRDITGEVRIGGRRFTFSIDQAGAPAGIYRGKASASGSAAKIGWIVLPDGSQVGIASTGTAKQPAPRLNPANPSVSFAGTTIRATPVTGATTF